MRLAVLADLHSNLHALEAVERSITSHGVDALVVLGDLVGYNAKPEQTVDWVRGRSAIAVAGNHDRDVTRDKQRAGTGRAATIAQAWTRTQLSDESLDFLSNLPNIHVEQDEFVAVHGCYLNPEHYYGYVTSTMLANNLESIWQDPALPELAFCGHTHMPLVGWIRHGEVHEFIPRQRTNWPRDADAVLLNPGAVGQPRDGDARACWALVDTAARWLELHRDEYPIDSATRAILDASLPEELAQRLVTGR